MFNWCPDWYGYLPIFESPEDDKVDVEEKLEEGEHLYWMDWDKYIGLNLRSSQSNEAAEPYLKEYSDVFLRKDFDQIPEWRPWDHAIDLTPGSKLVDYKVYLINPAEQKALDDFLEENLRTGRIRLLKSPMASPFFFVKKKDGSLCPV